MSYRNHFRWMTIFTVLGIFPMLLLMIIGLVAAIDSQNLAASMISTRPLLFSTFFIIGTLSYMFTWTAGFRVQWGLQKLSKLADLEEIAERETQKAITARKEALSVKAKYYEALQDLHGKIIVEKQNNQ